MENLIEQTNASVRRAIAAVRIERNPVTMGALYDAMNFRRNARSYVMPDWMRKAWAREVQSDFSAYGQVERSHAELAAAVMRHCPAR